MVFILSPSTYFDALVKQLNITRNQKGKFNCTATNEVGSKVSSNVVVYVRCKLLCDQ
jgi:hypothetical protein